MKRTVDVAWLAAFRFFFGATMAWSMSRFIAYDWIDAFFVEPAFHFKYFGFSWVEPLPRVFMHAWFYVLALLAIAVALGFYFRVAAIAFAIGFTYLQLIDVATYLNHYYLACLLAGLLAVSPAHRVYSLDVVRGRVAPIAEVPALWLWLFRFQVAIVYVSAGLAKATSDWLIHAQPLRIWLSSKTGLPIIGWVFAEPWAAPLFSWAGFLFDTTIVAFLLYRRTRPFAYVVLIGFHALTRVLFPIGMFPVIMVLSALVFFSPSWPRRWLGTSSRVPLSPPGSFSRPAIALLAVYVLVQAILPFRYLAYGGNVLWHEQGMRFSWRVMVREKNGSITYVVTEPASGRVRHVSPREYLTRVQERELSGQPDLILQLAHHIGRSYQERVEVRAETSVSLNGRRARPLVDPSIDLMQVEDGFAPASWITPAPSDPPPLIKPIAERSERR